MKRIIRILSLIAFVVSLFWAYHESREIEPYVSCIVTFVGFLLTFYDPTQKDKSSAKLRPKIYKKAVGIEELEPNKIPKIVFEFENIGNEIAEDLVILSGVYVGTEKLNSEPPKMVFDSEAPTTILPIGKTLKKTLPFKRAVTREELNKINNNELFVYAYSHIKYYGENDKDPQNRYFTKSCCLYNAVTTYFQNTPFFNKNT